MGAGKIILFDTNLALLVAPLWFDLGVFKSFLVQSNLIKNSMKVRRDYKWFNDSKFRVEIDQSRNSWTVLIFANIVSAMFPVLLKPIQ